VITGMRARHVSSTTSSGASAPCVAEICSEEQYAVAVGNTKLLLEGRNEDLVVTLRDRMNDAAEAERFEEAVSCANALRTVQTLRDRQQKVATTAWAIAMCSG
jgi:excinuclease ABC subunit C